MFANFSNVVIKAIISAVPQREICLEDELVYYGDSLKKAERARCMLGIDKRRIAFPGQTASDLCAFAAQCLLSIYPEARFTTDALIFVTQTPDFDLPATACILQHRLGIAKHCAAFDVNQGCAGYIYGLWLASSMLVSGACRQVLLLAGDVATRPRDVRNRIIAPIFGDGGSATLISYDATSQANIQFDIRTDGSGFANIIVPAGRGRMPYSEKHDENKVFFDDIIAADGTPWRLCDVFMDGKSIYNFTMNTVTNHIKCFLEKCHIEPNDLDYAVLHQANKQIVEAIATKVGLPKEKTPSDTFSRYGNLSSASIPAVLCDLFGAKGETGQRKLLLSGFGVGLTYGACLWESSNCEIRPVLSVQQTPPDKETSWKYWREYVRGKKHAG